MTIQQCPLQLSRAAVEGSAIREAGVEAAGEATPAQGVEGKEDRSAGEVGEEMRQLHLRLRSAPLR